MAKDECQPYLSSQHHQIAATVEVGMRVVIVGAGVAGAIMSRGLSRFDGVEVICLERARRGDHAESGTGLNICPNAVQALKQHDVALADAVGAVSLDWAHWKVFLTSGKLLFDLSLSDVANTNGWRLRWSDLYRVLRGAAGDVIRYDCNCVAAEKMPDGSGRTTIAWEDKTGRHIVSNIDLLIAGDGRFSMIRKAFAGAVETELMGVAIYRTLVDDTSGGLMGDYGQWFNGANRLLAYRVPPNHVYVNGTFPIAKEATIRPEQMTAEALRAFYCPQAGSPSDAVSWMLNVSCTEIDNLHWARVQESTPRFTEPDAHVLYLGDSSNGMVPTLGQGATQAIEGACAALSAFDRMRTSGELDIRGYLDRLAEDRERRIRFIMEFSRDASDTIFGDVDPVYGTLRKKRPDFLQKLQQLYNDFGDIAPLSVR